MRSYLLLCCALAASAQTSFRVVSGASYQPSIAPNAWAVILGTGLAPTTAIAAIDPNTGAWPTSLAGVKVQINGVDASLYYVSATQINVLVPDLTQFGSVPVTISRTNGATLTGTASLQNIVPDIFTNDSSGSGPGAILNAVTGAPAPFLVETPENGGADLRTYLAVYGTGLRYAGNLLHDPGIVDVSSQISAQGQDKAGNHYNFTVAYAGPANGFFGLDQLNIILPAGLDGAGVVSLTLTAAGAASSNTVTFQVNSLPTSSLRLAGVTVSPSIVTSGNTATVTASLNGVARASGFLVTFHSSNAFLTVPPIVTVPSGQSSATFTVTAPNLNSVQKADIIGVGGGSTQSATLEIDPVSTVQLTNFTVSPSSVQGGQSLTGTVTLSGPPTASAVSVQLSSDNTTVQPPASLVVPVGATSNSVTIPTSAVTTPQTATLTARAASVSLTAPVSVLPPFQFTLSNNSVTGGVSVTGTLTLGQPAPATGAFINLQSNNTAAAQPPISASIPAGQTTTTFSISTFTVTTPRTVTLTASYVGAGLTATTSLTVNPPGTPQLSSLAVNPTQVTGGAPSTGTVTLTAPAGVAGFQVSISSSSSFFAQIPSPLLTIPSGQTSATFTINTVHPPASVDATITATAAGISKTAVLTVK